MPADDIRSSGAVDAAMDLWLCRQNIERFRAQLAATSDYDQRAVLRTLLAEQEAKLSRLTPSSENDNNGHRAAAPGSGRNGGGL